MVKFLDNNGLLYLWQKIKALYATKEQLNTTNSNVTALDTKIDGVSERIPTKTSELTNDSGYQTANQVNSAISSAVGDITGIEFVVVDTLPSTGEKGTIYLLKIVRSGQNVYDEYIYVNGTWEKIGTTDVDLSNYWNNSNLVAIQNSEIDSIVTV